jgi:hypothetical protein
MAILWKTKSGQHLLLKEMSTEHITNTILMLVRKIQDSLTKHPTWSLQDMVIGHHNVITWIGLFQHELRTRNLDNINMSNWDDDNMGDDD